MLDNVNEILVSVTIVLAVMAVAIRLLQRVNRIEWVKNLFGWMLGWVDLLLSAIAIALVIRTFVVEPFRIPSGSMEDTLLIGDQLFVNRFIYGLNVPFTKARPLALRLPRHGDIVVFVPPHQRDKDFIKRVIGIPGDTVEIRRNVLYLNGKAQTEPYVLHKDKGRVPPYMASTQKFTVPPGKYFMMGDNRDRSADSRRWGLASFEDLKGKALFIFFSSDPSKPMYNPFTWIRWKRLFQGVG